MIKQFAQFVSRWAANSIGLIICSAVGIISVTNSWAGVAISAFLLAVLNAIIKPLLIIVSLPLIALSLGFFLIVINGLIMYLLSVLYSPIDITNFWYAMVAGIVIGLVNYIVTITYERFVSNE
jgi:putative membrane protein